MQNRYFGDVGDFGKYGLLRRISGVSAGDSGDLLSLGVAWYLVGDESHNEDGKHTTYLDKPEEYRDCDPGLFDGLKSLLDEPGPRAVSKIERPGLELLPRDTKYFSEPLTRDSRPEWLGRAIEKFHDCDVVFLDPDRGFQPPSVQAGHKNAVQYVLWDEAEQFVGFQRRQTLVCYHHLNRTKPWPEQIDEKIREIGSRIAGGDAAIPVLFRRGTGRVFFVLPSEQHHDLVASRVRAMAEDACWRRHMGIASGKETARKGSVGGSVRVGTWNVEWAKPGTPKGKRVEPILAAPNCDVLCVTEVGDAGLLPTGGHVIDAGTDWGYELPKASPGRRKVMLWSKRPWTPVFDPAQRHLPGGRLVAGVTETPVGRLTVVGVCIPWSGAHVDGGRRDRVQWQDHLDWLSGFERLSYARSRRRTIVLGDFNQRTPKGGKLHSALTDAFMRLRISTAGFLDGTPSAEKDSGEVLTVRLREAAPDKDRSQLIDHIAHSEDLTPQQAKPSSPDVHSVGIFPPREQGGKKLSDHTGVWLDLKKT